jgi:hypothetical protein
MNELDDVWELLQNITLHYTWPVNTTITPAEAEDERSALRKLALAALQFLANLTAGNARTASWVFKESYNGRFLEYLEAFSKDRDLLMCMCVIIHNHLALAEEKGLAVEMLIEDGALICKLMRILLPQSTSSPFSSSFDVEEHDPVFEWVYLILLKILETGQGKEAFEKTGLDEDTLHDLMADFEPQSDDEWSTSDATKSESLKKSVKQQGLYEPPPVFTAEQLVFVNLLEHILTDTYVHGASNSSSSSSSSASSANAEQKEEGKEGGGVKSSSLLVIKDGGGMLVEMVNRVKTCLKYRPIYTPTTTTTTNAAGQQQQQQQQHPYCAEVMMIEEAIATVIRLLAGALAMGGEGEEGREGGGLDREVLVENGLVGVILTLLRQEGGQADGSIPPMDAAAAVAAAATAREGRKAQLIRVLGNLCHRCRSAQDEVRREEGGLALVLNHCNVDSSNPFLREWALFCVRNLCEDNGENQRVVSELHVQGAVQTSMLKEVGLEARLVERGGEGGRARVTLAKAGGHDGK